MIVLDSQKLEDFDSDEVEVLKDFGNKINPHLEKMMKVNDMNEFEMSAYAQNRFSKAGLKKQFIREKIDSRFKNHNKGRSNKTKNNRISNLKRSIFNHRESLAKNLSELASLTEPIAEAKNSMKRNNK